MGRYNFLSKSQITKIKNQSRSDGTFACRKFISLLLVETNKRYPKLKFSEDPATSFLREVQLFLSKFQDKELNRAYNLTKTDNFKHEILELLLSGLKTRQKSYLNYRKFFLENENLTKKEKKIRRNILNADAKIKRERHPENWGRAGELLQGGAPGLGKRK